MAEFCKQCSLELFDHDTGDFKNMSTKKQTKQGLYTVVLCEGCGPCQVDHTGECVSVDCLRGHGAGDVVIETDLTDGQHVAMSMPEEMFEQLGEHPEVKRRAERKVIMNKENYRAIGVDVFLDPPDGRPDLFEWENNAVFCFPCCA